MPGPSFLRNKLQGIVRDTGWTGANEVLTLLTALVVLQVLVVGLGPAAYGKYAAIAALSAILMTMSSVWVVMLLLQYTLQAGQPVAEAFRVALGLALPASLLALAIGAALGPVLIPTLSFPVIVAFIAADLLSGILFLVSGAAVQAVDGLPAATRIRLLGVFTRFVVIVGVGVSGQASLPLLAASLFIGNAVVGLIVFYRVTRRLGLPRVPAFPRLARAREGLPYAGVLASMSVQEDSDKIFLQSLVSPVDAGLYAAAYKVVQLGFIPVRALMSSSHPRFLVNTPGAKREHVRRAVRFTLPTALYGVLATVGIIILAPVVPEIFGAEYEGTLPLLIGLAPLVLLRTLSLFAPNALLGLGRFTLRFKAVLGCTVVNLVLNAALIPVLSVTGAIIATLLTEVTVIIVLWWCVVRAQQSHDAVEPGTAEAARSGEQDGQAARSH